MSNTVSPLIETEPCMSCHLANIPCFEKSRPCLNCISFGSPSTCVDSLAQALPAIKRAKAVPSKRGVRPHVPSACINCKTAHLGCDVSRPCERCVKLNKADTCQDVLHKKRGRPKRQTQNGSQSTYDIIYGTIETPAIDSSQKNGTLPRQIQPKSHSKPISFIHESFQASPPQQEWREKTIPTDVSDSDQTAPSPESPLLKPPPPPLLDDILPDPSNDFLTSLLNTPLLNVGSFIIPETFTLVLSTELCCARVPDEVYSIWGYHPQELAHRSLYDFVSPKDTYRLSQIHRRLLDHTARVSHQSKPLPPAERSTSHLFSTTDMDRLKVMAKGSTLCSDTLQIKTSLGNLKAYEVTLFIGGGLGGDLFHPTTLSRFYIVAQCRPANHTPITPPAQEPLLTQPSLVSPKPFSAKFNVAPSTVGHLFHPQRSRPVTHPTHQYFLQTSSSTLNSAASAVKGPHVFSMSGSSHRHIEDMSIRSLLC
ncbi:hypothetical protein BY458DRAFT_561047 [Sporodiniella umbellata]|nr:hypothetical protein BY458DRAFT_561047 [Sporodiniella umbellata]